MNDKLKSLIWGNIALVGIIIVTVGGLLGLIKFTEFIHAHGITWFEIILGLMLAFMVFVIITGLEYLAYCLGTIIRDKIKEIKAKKQKNSII